MTILQETKNLWYFPLNYSKRMQLVVEWDRDDEENYLCKEDILLLCWWFDGLFLNYFLLLCFLFRVASILMSVRQLIFAHFIWGMVPLTWWRFRLKSLAFRTLFTFTINEVIVINRLGIHLELECTQGIPEQVKIITLKVDHI